MRNRVRTALAAVVAFAALAWGAAAFADTSGAVPEAAASAQLKALADDMLAWHTATDASVRLQRGIPITQFDGLDRASAERRSYEARGLLERLRSIEVDRLSTANRVFAAAMEHDLVFRAEEARFQSLEFIITPYRGGDVHQFILQVLSTRRLANQADIQNYLGLLSSYARVLDDIDARLQTQRKLNILLPKPAIETAVKTLASLEKSVTARLTITPERIASVPKDEGARFMRDVQVALNRDISPRIARLRRALDAKYVAAAPAAVGLAQYPDGAAYYRHLIYGFTGEALDAKAVHDLGLTRIAEIDAQLAALRQQIGFAGTRSEFHQLLRTDPRWIARTPQEVEDRYLGFVGQMAPKLPDYFSMLPTAGYGVKRLDPAAEPGMTYGYYQMPTDAEPTGFYRYNGSNLSQRSLIGAQHLIYHELIPGHHLQLVLEREAPATHPLRQLLSSAAYTEGWAEYAASLGEEMGLYGPYDRYGHLMMQSFLAARLVVDTGLNAFGWTLDQAREFMREHTLESETQIDSELLRYSTDIPGQALGYYLGYEKMRELRRQASAALGEKFDIKAFHAALLGTGSVPLNALDRQIQDFIATARRGVEAVALSATHFAAVNRAQIMIDRPPDAVWKALLDRSTWMPSFGGKEVIAGQPDTTGELSIYTSRSPSGKTNQRLEEVLIAIPNELLVLRLGSLAGDATYAFAEFQLERRGRKTHVDFNLYWTDQAPAGASPEATAHLKGQYMAETQKTLEKELENLDRAVRAAR